MGWRTAINAYCERLGPEFWAEPVNAITNLAFILGAALPYLAMRRRGQNDALLTVLCIIALCVGVGSFLFHTFAERWAALADVIPILLFIVTFLYAAMNRFFGLRWPWAILAVVLAFGVSLLARNLGLWVAGGSLNGSEAYFPALALLGGSALVLALRSHKATGAIALATVIFALSLTARSIDESVCIHLPLGTHFLWHVLNGTMIGVLLFALLNHGKRP